jgi:hypothetical protein
VSDSSSLPSTSENTRDSHEEEPFAERGTLNSSVQSNDMVEIAMSLRQISEAIENSAINRRAAGATEESDFWLDGDYLYVDIEHPRSDELMMDICVHRGRAFIRVARDGLGMEVVEMSA